MKLFQILKTVTAGLILIMATNVFAAGLQVFDRAAFDAAKARGETIVLDFHADWCPTCKKQGPILDSLLSEPEMNSVVGFKVDYDNATALKKALNVQKQSTLIVFKGEKEVARQMGLTNKDEIKALLLKGK